MKILLLRNTVADGRSVSAGQEVEVLDATGRALVQMGKAREIASEIAAEVTHSDSPRDDEAITGGESAAGLPADEPMGGLITPAAPPTRHSKQAKGKVGK